MKHVLKISEPISESIVFNSHLCKQALGTVASCLICLCSGLTTGISSVMLPQLRQDESIQYNPDHDSWIASIVTVSMIIGSVVCGQMQDSYGRKAAHIIIGVPFIVGWIVIGCASTTGTILVGRFITGLSAGCHKVVPLVYIGEIVDPKIRSVALFCTEIAALLGILVSHILGYYVPWKLSSIICIIPAAVSLISFIFLKESPLWLIAKGRAEEGIDTFRWFRGTETASEVELNAALQRQSEEPTMSAKKTLKIICTMAFIKPMMVLMVVMLLVQLSGLNILRFYSQDIFDRTFSGSVTSFTMTITVDSVRGVMPVAYCVFQKYIPKKVVLLACTLGAPVFVFGLVACLKLDYKSFVWVPVSCLVMYIFFLSVLLPIGWTFVPELLPNAARGLGSGLNSALSFVILFIFLKITPDILNTYGAYALFTIFGISILICGIILWIVLPDTSGRTLQSIEDSFSKKNIIKANVG